jgi:hypothetical protein
LRAAYRKREIQNRKPTAKRPTLHVARFIICALYTGSRAARVWRASFEREAGRPWVDVDSGLFIGNGTASEEARSKPHPLGFPAVYWHIYGAGVTTERVMWSSIREGQRTQKRRSASLWLQPCQTLDSPLYGTPSAHAGNVAYAAWCRQVRNRRLPAYDSRNSGKRLCPPQPVASERGR